MKHLFIILLMIPLALSAQDEQPDPADRIQFEEEVIQDGNTYTWTTIETSPDTLQSQIAQRLIFGSKADIVAYLVGRVQIINNQITRTRDLIQFNRENIQVLQDEIQLERDRIKELVILLDKYKTEKQKLRDRLDALRQ